MKEINPTAIKEAKQHYQQRDVLTLKKLSDWTEEEIAAHLKENRILQPEFTKDNVRQIIKDAAVCQQDWLTDVICPSIEAALTLNIAKELVIYYKASENELNTITKEIFDYIKKIYSKELEQLENSLVQEIETQQKIIRQRANNKCLAYCLKNNCDSETTTSLLESFIRIETNIFRKKFINEQITKIIKNSLNSSQYQGPRLVKKQVKKSGQNTDYSFLGAAGSGKSFIMKKYLTEEQIRDTILLSTDSYRGVFVPNTESFESQPTKQGFIKTQDSAYLIKELIQIELEENLTKNQQRSDVLLDCISLEPWHRRLLEHNQTTTSVVAALDDVRLVPERAYKRAENKGAGPADKGRYVNTTALLEGHQNASKRLLTGIPENVITNIFDTNSTSTSPSIIANIDTREKNLVINILNLNKFADFIGKANINPNATSSIQVYKNDKARRYQFTYSKDNKAEAIINLIRGTKQSSPNIPRINFEDYAYICNNQGTIELVINDKNKFLQELHKNPVLKEIALQIYHGNLAKTRRSKRIFGVQNSIKQSLNPLKTGKASKRP